MKRIRLVLSCEHGGAEIPAPYRPYFQSSEARSALGSHRGSDLGALWVAKRLAENLEVPLYATTVSRLLVDTNRSEHHPRLFSEWSEQLSPAEREQALADYRTHRARVSDAVQHEATSGARVLHVAVHSFTPELNGQVRNADIGLLYDPSRAWEARLCRRWQRLFGPNVRVRRNYPYRGTADGLTTALRRRFKTNSYAGIELELAQAITAKATPRRMALARLVEHTLRSLIENEPEAP